MTSAYFQNVAYGYSTLLNIFKYLKVRDLLHAMRVCTMWRDIANHPILWKTARIENFQTQNFDGLCKALNKHRTTHLHLSKMLLPNNSENVWVQFNEEIMKVDTLKTIELCNFPAAVIEEIAVSNPNLEVINTVMIKCESISRTPLECLKNVTELRLKSTSGFSLNCDLSVLAHLTHLQHLSITRIKYLNTLNIEVIVKLTNLKSLDLEECQDLPQSFGSDILARLCKLEKLRLDNVQGNCYTFEILHAVRIMPRINHLELLNFDIKPGFENALGACMNIKKLLIVPTYTSQDSVTNHTVLRGVLRLQHNLSHFVWGFTPEFLQVIEESIDNINSDTGNKKKTKQAKKYAISILKPVPLLNKGTSLTIPPAQDLLDVQYLPLSTLKEIFGLGLPRTHVNIYTKSFKHNTWSKI